MAPFDSLLNNAVLAKMLAKTSLTWPAFFVPVPPMSLSKKRGRKRKDFPHPTTGLPVVGLTRMTDDRWRIIGTQIRFTEPDVQKAITRFYRLMGEKQYEGLPPEEIEWLQTPASVLVDGNAATALSRGFALIGKPEEAWRRFWAYVGQEIRTRPKWVAEQTGVEQIGYFTDVKPPAPLPSFTEIQMTYMKYARCSVLQRKKQLRGFKDFIETAEVESLRDICPETVVAYQDEVQGRIVIPSSRSPLHYALPRLSGASTLATQSGQMKR